MSHPELTRVLLTGASGYVGGRLLAELQSRGMAVRCLARRPEFLLPKVAPGGLPLLHSCRINLLSAAVGALRKGL